MKSKIKIPERQKLQLLYKRQYGECEIALNKLFRQMRGLFKRNKLNFTIKSRVKSFEGYFEKIIRLYNNNEPVVLTDLLGLRIICPFMEDIDKVKNLIIANFSVIEEESKGAEHSFREFGYDSTHLLINIPDNSAIVEIPYTKRVFEVQLRTILQEAWAEVEHELIYKASLSFLTEPIRRKLAALNASLNLSDIIFQEIRDYQKEIQKRREKRGDSLLAKLHIIDKIDLLENLDPIDNKQEDIFTLPLESKSPIDKLILEALDEHSNSNYTKAITTYSHILRMKPSKHVRSIIYNHRGMAYFSMAKYRPAINDFSKAIEYNQENISAWNNRGLSYRLIEEYESALVDLTRSLEINGYQVETYYSRALVNWELHDHAKALKDCEEALNIKPNFAAGKKLRSIIQAKLAK